MSAEVYLTWGELAVSGNVGIMLRVHALKNNAKEKYGAPKNDGAWECSIIGAMAEMAVAKYFNLYWGGNVGEFDKIDVGGLIEVRARRETWHEMILHDKDLEKGHLPFVHVIANPPKFMVVGWIYGREGVQKKFWKDPAGNRPAYFVPAALLRPIETLPIKRAAMREMVEA